MSTQAAPRVEITDIQYDLPGAVVLPTPPVRTLLRSVRNDSGLVRTEAIPYTFDKWVVGTWNNADGIELGERPTFTAGVPYVADPQLNLLVSAPSQHTFGGDEGVRQTIKAEAVVQVHARKEVNVFLLVRTARIVSVPFTYKLTIRRENGEVEETVKNGVYRNIDTLSSEILIETEDI